MRLPPATHCDGDARLFRLALESARAGSVLHAVGDEGVPVRVVAEVFADRLGISAVSVDAEQAGEFVGWLGRFWSVDGPASAEITRDLLGWQPTGAGPDQRPQGGPLLRLSGAGSPAADTDGEPGPEL